MELKKNPKADLTRKSGLFFSIALDGSIVDAKVIKGIGMGCDEEALRVIHNAPAWSPGKQRGVAVRQKMVVPVIFRIGG